MTAGSAQDVFYYPTSQGVLRSVDEYAATYLPAMHDLAQVAPRMRRTLEMIHANSDRNARQNWLDYGAGGGVFAHHLGKATPQWHVTGWEGDYSSHRIAADLFALPNVTFERHPYDAYNAMPEGQWDGITLLEVIEHVDNAGSILPRFHAALRPGGLLVVSTPNFLGWQNLRMEVRRRLCHVLGIRSRAQYLSLINAEAYDPSTDAGHIATHTVWTLSMLLRKHGFIMRDFCLAELSSRLAHRVFPDTLIVVAQKAVEP